MKKILSFGSVSVMVCSVMDYYSSAKNITISKARAIKELKAHGVTDAALPDFFEELGDHENYLAQDVLLFLGY